MKTKTKSAKKSVKKAAGKPANKAASKYACSVCGTLIEANPCGCGCDTAVDLICCGKQMTKKSA